MEPTNLIHRAAMYLYLQDAALMRSEKSFDAWELTELRKELLTVGYSEAEVDANGKLEPLCISCGEFTQDMGRDHCPECGGCDDCGLYIGGGNAGVCEQGKGCKSFDNLRWSM